MNKYSDAKIPKYHKKSKTWLNAYSGAGSYYTLKNMVMYHNVFVNDEYGDELKGSEALEFVNKFVNKNGKKFWLTMDLLRRTIKSNNFTF